MYAFLLARVSFLLFDRLQALLSFPDGSEGKEPACIAGDASSIPESGRCPGGGSGNPLQCSCLENHMDRGAWWATVQREEEKKSLTQLSD